MACFEDWQKAKKLYDDAQIVEAYGGYTLSTLLDFLEEMDERGRELLILERIEDWEEILKTPCPLVNY